MAFLTRFHQRIVEQSQNAYAAPLIIVALGDSVTAGAGPGDQLFRDEVYHAQLKRMLEQRYSQGIFNVINAGVGGQNATEAIERLEGHVLHHAPDLLLVAYGLNDAGGGDIAGLETYADALRTIIRRTREATSADIILLTPNMMPAKDSPNVPDHWQHLTEHFIHLQKDGVLAAYTQRVCEIGEEQGVAVANVYAAWEELAASGVDTTAMLVNGLNHPDAAGHLLAAQVVMRAIEEGS